MRRRRKIVTGSLEEAEVLPAGSGTATSTAPTDYSVSNSILNTGLNTVVVQYNVTNSSLVDYAVFS